MPRSRPEPERPKQQKLLSVRLTSDIYQRWHERARFEGITASAAARRAILRELRSAANGDRAAS